MSKFAGAVHKDPLVAATVDVAEVRAGYLRCLPMADHQT